MTPEDDDAASASTLSADELLLHGMRTLRDVHPPPGADALEVIERIEAEVAHRQGERGAAANSRRVDEYPLTEDDDRS